MFKYVVKRLVYFVPTLLVISLFAFALSKLAPGDPVERRLQGNNQGGGGQLSEQLAGEKAYYSLAQKMGLHLPTFYFSISSQAYPDSLYKYYRKSERENLSGLIDQYGNWPEIEAYYASIKELELALFDVERNSYTYDRLQIVRERIVELLKVNQDQKITRYLEDIQTAVDQVSIVPVDSSQYDTINYMQGVIEPVQEVVANYSSVKEKATPYKKYIPAIHWYGHLNQYHRWLLGDVPWIPKKVLITDLENITSSVQVEIQDSGYYRIQYWQDHSLVQDDYKLLASGNVGSSDLLNNDEDILEENRMRVHYFPNYDPSKTGKGFFRGDFGVSYLDGRPVKSKIMDALIITIQLNLIALLLSYFISIPVGVTIAVKKGTTLDRITTTLMFVLYSLPSFWIATLLIVFFTTSEYGMDFFPTYGLNSNDLPDNVSWLSWLADRAYHLVLPVFCMTYGSFAYISRQMRGGMINVIRQDYIRTAQAKGLSQKMVIWKHAFRNSLIPIITMFASLFPIMISGSVVIEVIFNIPGMGRLGFDAVLGRDYPVLFTVLMFSAILTMVGMLVADLFYSVVDPRISFTKKAS